MKTDNLNIGIVIWLMLFVSTSCMNQTAYSDGQWWAEECCKMLEDKNYDSPVTKQYIRMKSHTDNCDSNFYDGFEAYSTKASIHQEYLGKQLRLMMKDCEDDIKE